MKPKIYIETSIPSYLTAKTCNDIRAMANKNITMEWWERRRHKFDIFISEFVFIEASRGDPGAAFSRTEIIKEFPELKVTEEVKFLAKALITNGPIPKKAEIDAYHIAVAAVHGIEYLLTWNCTHLANAALRLRLEDVCRRYGYEPPIICTPLELME